VFVCVCVFVCVFVCVCVCICVYMRVDAPRLKQANERIFINIRIFV
jgi:hypothetical protein